MPTFTITISGLPEFAARLAEAPAVTTSILQETVAISWAILGKHTTKDTVPWLTGFLTQGFSGFIAPLMAYWYPTASYARFVEFGTAPHMIYPKDAKALYWPGAGHPVRSVSHVDGGLNPRKSGDQAH
jgi:hypothetical protein